MGRNYSATAVDTTLAAAISSTVTSISVMSTVGLPTPPFVAAIIDSPGVQEVVLVTGIFGTTMTVTRGYDDTVAAAHPATAVFRHVASAIDFREAQQHIDATTGVHGVGAGAVVGTSTIQTLTNKNLTSGTNTFPTFITGYLVPTGAEMGWPSMAAAPAGWLKEDGGEYPIATYTALYNFLTSNGTAFPHGANTNGSGGAGSTHFRTPNRSGRVAVGYDAAHTEFNAIGKTNSMSTKTHTLSITEMPSHNHGGATGGAGATGYGNSFPTSSYDSVGWTLQNEPGGYWGRVMVSDFTFDNTNHVHSVSPQGGGGAHNNLQPYIVTNFIIKT